MSGIYQIRCIPNGKVYIGSAVNITKRWAKHRSDLGQGIHHSRHLQGAWDKFGADAFAFEILEVVEDKADLVRVEQEYLDLAGSYWRTRGYNLSPTAGSWLGRRHSKQSRARISDSVKKAFADPAVRAEMSAQRKGRRHSLEARANMEEAQKKMHADPAWRDKVSLAKKGKPLTPEHCAAMSAARKGKSLSPEHCAKIAASQKGKKRSPETVAKVAASHRGRKRSAQARANMAAAMKAIWADPEYRASRAKAQDQA